MSQRPVPTPTQPAAADQRLLRLALPAFAVALWLFATLGLGGQIGRSTDDYSFSLINPATGQPPPISRFDPWVDKPYFWRPVHQVYLFAARTYLDKYDRGLHIFVAVMHGMAGFLLYRFLREATGAKGTSLAVAMIFMVLPVHHEVALWLCTTSTAIGSALWLWLAIAMVRWARGPTTPRSWRSLAPMTVLALAIPFFYEQPGAAVAALPLLYLATCDRSQSWRARLVRSLGSTFALGMTQVAFASLMFATTDAARRGGSDTLVPLAHLGDRAAEVGRLMLNQLSGPPLVQMLEGSSQLGLDLLRSSIAWVWAVPLALTLIASLVAAASTRQPEPETADAPPFRLGFFALFGAAVIVLSMLPVAAVAGHNVAPRMLYVPLLGASIALSALLHAPARFFPRATASARVRVPAVLGLAAVALPCAACLLGVQAWYQRASRLDERMLSTLAALVPDPPPGAVFVPVRIAAMPTTTGLPLFDRLRPNVFAMPTSAEPAVRRAIGRTDVHASSRNPWREPEIRRPTSGFARIHSAALVDSSVLPGGEVPVPWDRLIPFVVDPSGQARLVRAIVFDRDDGTELTVRPPIVARLLSSNRLDRASTVQVRMDSAEPLDTTRPLPGWSWSADAAPVEFIPFWPWRDYGPARRAAWMHPTAAGGRRSAMNISLPPGTRPQRIVIPATIGESEVRRREVAATIELAAAIDGGSPAATLRLDRATARNGRRWFRIVIDCPPTSDERRLTISVRAADGAPGRPIDPVWVGEPRLVESVNVREAPTEVAPPPGQDESSGP